MAIDAIIATFRKPVSMQTTFLVENVTRANLAESLKHLFDPNINSVSSLSTTCYGSVTYNFTSVPKATKKTVEWIVRPQILCGDGCCSGRFYTQQPFAVQFCRGYEAN